MINVLQIKNHKYWHLSKEKVAEILDTNTETGLSFEEARERLRLFGRNDLNIKKKTSRLKTLINQFKSPLIFVLIIAGVVTLFISDFKDAVFIFFAVVVNSVLGFWQENKAERALSELKSYLKQRARVIRDDVEREIDVEEIVPGDMIHISQGDRVPADARLIFANDLEVDESVLTGESLPVTKSDLSVKESAVLGDQSSMVFAGTLVTQGVASAIVCRTDAATELGKIASLISKSEDEKTPLQKAIIKFSIQISIVLILLTVCIFVVGIASGESFLQMFLTSVAIAVSAIPEGLPISMTVILAIGVERMAKRKGVVRKLLAAEALGSTTVILTDKTGTLTQAIMRMSKIITFGVSESELIHHALKNSNVIIENPEDEPEFWRINGRIMEVALAKSSALRGVPVEKIMNKKDVLQYLPFNAAKKFSVSLVKEGNKYFTYFYGAPDILLNHSSFTEEKKKEILEEIDKLSLSGERVLGCARKEVKNIKDYSLAKDLELKNIEFEGLLTFHDPVRPGLQNIIKRVHRAGIRTIIVTGDYKGTALSVAKEVGIFTGEHSVLDGKEIDTLKDLDLKDRLKTVSVISRVTPAHKLRIASILQSMGEIVAMTGDGVNDAPSIKQANVGIAMGSGTEVARDVADLVLLDDNFETIVAAIEEGRQILGNIKKVLVYLLSNVTDGLILIGGSILVGVALPLNALQILWVNFFSDSLPAIAFAFEKDTDGLFGYNTLGNQVKNSINKTGLFDPLMKFLILIIGISTSALLFVIYLYLLRAGYDLELVKTFTFAAFGTYTLLVALSVRSFNKSILSYPVFSNVYLTFGIVVGFVLMAMAIYVPLFQNLFNTVALPLSWVFGVLMVGIFNILLIEIAKWYFRVRRSV